MSGNICNYLDSYYRTKKLLLNDDDLNLILKHLNIGYSNATGTERDNLKTLIDGLKEYIDLLDQE